MKVTVQFEFDSVEAAIAALGKQMVGASGVAQTVERVTDKAQVAGSNPAAGNAPTSRSRKPRADAGKPRGPYKEPVNANATPVGSGTADPSNEAPAQKAQASTLTSTPLAPAVAPKTPASATPAEGDKPQPSGAKSPMAGVPVTLEDCRASLEKLFDAKGIVAAQDVLSRFGVKRAGDMLPSQYADFIQYVNEQTGG